MPELTDVLPKLTVSGVTYMKEVAPGTHAYASRQAMHRVRAYHTANLSPVGAGRYMQEMLLVGHVHVADGKVTRIEGFNGGEGSRWAEAARAKLEAAGLLAPDAEVVPATPLRACAAAWTTSAGR